MGKSNRPRGFTIIEIVVVAAILALLVAIVLKVSSAVSQRAKATSTAQTIRLTCEAVEAFHSSTGYYPLPVPEDAWDDWMGSASSFVAVMEWGGRWRDYFQPVQNGSRPAYEWGNDGKKPTNIHMLAFQLEQVPESNAIFQRIKNTIHVDTQKAFDPNGTDEEWEKANEACQLYHPLDDAGTGRQVFQIQDAWGMPLRYWSADILRWARRDGTTWDADVQQLLASQLQAANWGFFVESAGPDDLFGWWGQQGCELKSEYAADNIYSTGK